MPAPLSETFAVRSDQDVVAVRRAVRSAAVAIPLRLVAQTKLVTAASELARNAVVHGGGGVATVETVRDSGRNGIRIEIADNGPGIPDLELALTDGFTTGAGLGCGLGGSRRLVHEFEVVCPPDGGTRVVAVMWE